MIYGFAQVEAWVLDGTITRDEGDALHGYARWLRTPAAERSANPSESEMLLLGEVERDERTAARS